jgi:hypothetical protein
VADKNLRATQAQLCDALGACTELKPIYRRLLKMFLEELQLIDQQISEIDQELANRLSRYHDSVVHLAEIPGFGVDSVDQHHQLSRELEPTLSWNQYRSLNRFQGEAQAQSCVIAFHEKAGWSQVGCFIFCWSRFPLGRVATVATLPSALSNERFSLGASVLVSAGAAT